MTDGRRWFDIFKAISSAQHWYFFFSLQTIFQFHPEFQDDSAFLNLPVVCEFTIPSKPNKEKSPSAPRKLTVTQRVEHSANPLTASQLVPPCQGWSWPWKDNGDTPGSWVEDKGFAPPWRHCVTQRVTPRFRKLL